MTDLEFARAQMTVSLAFHILFAVAGMAMPLLMLIAGVRHARTGDPVYEDLFERWAKGTAILFAVGAVSGTVLSFELGLLWPGFMRVFGPVVGLAFAMEGWAFFLEAIFLGLLLYGGKGRISVRMRLFSAAVVAGSGLASGIFVMGVNAFMHLPTHVTLAPDGSLADFSPWAPFLSPAFPSMAAHMALAAYASVAMLVLGVHAAALRRHPGSAFHRAAVRIALGVALVTVPAQIATGDWSAKHIAEHQPLKLAAAEGLFETTQGAPLAIGGWPDADAGRLRGAIHVPKLLSILAFADPDAVVQGLEDFPREEWPNLPVVHVAFQVMILAGSAMLGVVLLGGFLTWRRKGDLAGARTFLALAAWTAPLGLLAVEAGWVVAEAGRQPWIVRGLMRVKDAVVTMPGLGVPFAVFTGLYVVLGLIVIAMLRAHVSRTLPEGKEAP